MAEPFTPEKYYISTGKMEVDGKRGTGRIKKWYDTEEECFKEKVLDFSPFKENPCESTQ